MRAQAHIEVVEELKPVYLIETGEPAENIELARVLGWWVVVKKGEYKVGDMTVYIEIDSIVPKDNLAFDFLASKGFKVKTMKLNKFYAGTDETSRVISQGLLMPLSIITKTKGLSAGTDVTKELGIIKIEDETPEQRNQSKAEKLKTLQQTHWFLKTRLARRLLKYKFMRKIITNMFVKNAKVKRFPNFVEKTDETRIQALPKLFEQIKGTTMQVTEKLDGTSTTFALSSINSKKPDFAVCSRNIRQQDRKQKTYHKEAESNVYWEMADKYNIQSALVALAKELHAEKTIYIQGETIGTAVQSNKYALSERQFYAFNLVVDGKKIDSIVASELLSRFGIKWVPILNPNFVIPETIDELVKYAIDKSVMHDTLREGVVIRNPENTISFKVINPEFLLKWKL